MPSPTARALIDVYARGLVADGGVYHDRAYRDLCARHEGDGAFDVLRANIEQDKKELEALMPGKTPAEQVREAFNGVRRRRGASHERQQQYSSLVERTYGGSWSPAQLSYFTDWALFLFASQDYFLSFTNRNPTPGLRSGVNAQHEWFIKKVLGTTFDADDESQRNLLAATIHYLLAQANLQGFYFPEHGGGSYDVSDKMERECDRALAFVQIVQAAMFIDAPSYCHLEFDRARASRFEKLFVFVDAESALPHPAVVHSEFLGWFDAVQRAGRVPLTQTGPVLRTKDVEKNLAQILKTVIDPIKTAALDKLYLNVPI